MKEKTLSDIMFDLVYLGGEYIAVVLVDKETHEIYDYYIDMEFVPAGWNRNKYRIDTMCLKDVLYHV